jgi:hypothetical protein
MLWGVFPHYRHRHLGGAEQITDPANFMVERPCLIFRLKNPKNGSMSDCANRVHPGQIQSRLRMDFNSRWRFAVVLG